MTEDVKSLLEELMKLIGIEAQVNVNIEEKKSDEEQTTVYATVDAKEEAGLLIGGRGATLHAIQAFVAMAMKQKHGEWVRVVVDIGDWRQKHEEYLTSLANQAAERARQTGEAQYLYNLSPNQRRVIHLALSREGGIETQSEGEGENRYLKVIPKSE